MASVAASPTNPGGEPALGLVLKVEPRLACAVRPSTSSGVVFRVWVPDISLREIPG